MRDGALHDRHEDDVLLGVIDSLGDGIGDFVGLAEADADVPLAVADNDDRVEAEPTSALHHLGDTVDVDELVFQLQFTCLDSCQRVTSYDCFLFMLLRFTLAVGRGFEPLLTAPKAAVLPLDDPTMHRSSTSVAPLMPDAVTRQNFKSAFARTIGQRFHDAVVQIPVPVEHHLRDVLLQRLLRRELPDLLAPAPSAPSTSLNCSRHVLREVRHRDERLARRVVDDLGIDVLQAPEHRQPRALASVPEMVSRMWRFSASPVLNFLLGDHRSDSR